MLGWLQKTLNGIWDRPLWSGQVSDMLSTFFYKFDNSWISCFNRETRGFVRLRKFLTVQEEWNLFPGTVCGRGMSGQPKWTSRPERSPGIVLSSMLIDDLFYVYRTFSIEHIRPTLFRFFCLTVDAAHFCNFYFFTACNSFWQNFNSGFRTAGCETHIVPWLRHWTIEYNLERPLPELSHHKKRSELDDCYS